jgi:hypothetical protein
MILDHHGEMFHGRVERRTFGNGPGFQGSVDFEAEIVVKVGRVVALDAVLQGMRMPVGSLGSRFRRAVEMAFLDVFLKRHGKK